LLNRTTRQLSLTEEGERYFRRMQVVLQGCSAARLKLPLSTTATKIAISSDVALIVAPIAKFY
jgi:DNA-binding transcriptional LysR family regulator